MTEDQLTAFEQLHQQATPGYWYIDTLAYPDPGEPPYRIYSARTKTLVAQCFTEYDAMAIKEMHNEMVPWLIAEWRRWQALLTREQRSALVLAGDDPTVRSTRN